VDWLLRCLFLDLPAGVTGEEPPDTNKCEPNRCLAVCWRIAVTTVRIVPVRFTDGLDRWELGGTFLRQGTGFDYSATAEDGHAILAAAVPEPAGFAFLAQDIEPDDYRGRTVTFRGELRTAGADGRSGLALRASSPGRSAPPRAAGPDPRDDPASHIAFAQGTGAWIQYEVTAQVPADANLVRFGVFLNGGGQVELRKPQLEPH
jgi:hypothetical protein